MRTEAIKEYRREILLPLASVALVFVLDHYVTDPSYVLAGAIAIVVAAAELSLSFSIRTLNANAGILEQLSILSRCLPIYSEYASHADFAEQPLRQWFQRAVKRLSDEIESGWVPLLLEDAPQDIGTLYARATHNVVATSVGIPRQYLGNSTNYVQYNKDAAMRHVQIVRFFLFDESISDVAHREKSLKQFCEQVERLHNDTGCVYSVVLDLSLDRGFELRDVLLIDNRFLAENKLSHDALRARHFRGFDASAAYTEVRATTRQFEINAAREYLEKLWGHMRAAEFPGADASEYRSAQAAFNALRNTIRGSAG